MPTTISDCIESILSDYKSARLGRKKDAIAVERRRFDRLGQLLKKMPPLKASPYVSPIQRIGVALNLQRCPQLWLADDRIWNSPSYIDAVLQFPENMSGVYLGICKTDIEDEEDEDEDEEDYEESVSLPSSGFLKYVKPLSQLGFKFRPTIDVYTNRRKPDEIAAAGWVATKWLPSGAIPSDKQFQSDLTAVLSCCDRCYADIGVE